MRALQADAQHLETPVLLLREGRVELHFYRPQSEIRDDRKFNDDFETDDDSPRLFGLGGI